MGDFTTQLYRDDNRISHEIRIPSETNQGSMECQPRVVLPLLMLFLFGGWNCPPLKLTAKAPENVWLEDDRFLLEPG